MLYTHKRRIFIAILITVLYVLLTTCFRYIDKFLGGNAVLPLIVFVVFTVLLISFVRSIITIIKNRRRLSFATFLPLIIYIMVPLVGSFVDLGRYESKVVLRGCYEGTQNQAYVLFRENNTFELNWTGVFFYSKWYTGTWKRNGDIIYLNYNNNKMVESFGKKVAIVNGYFKPQPAPVDSIMQTPIFYVGYCKGEN